MIVFNAPPKLEDTTKLLNFSQVLISPAPMDPDLVIKMAHKIEAKFDWTQEEPKVIFNKDDPRSIAEVQQVIQVKSITESDISFYSTKPIDLFTTLRIESPAPFYFTVLPPPKSAKDQKAYYGLIHTVGEDEKKKIRQYINQIFFRELEEKKKAEKEEFEKVQQSALAKRSAEADAQAKKDAEEKARLAEENKRKIK